MKQRIIKAKGAAIMEKVKNGILKIIQVWRVMPKAQFMLMLWWIFLLILIIALPSGFGAIVAIIYFPYVLLKRIIKYVDKKR